MPSAVQLLWRTYRGHSHHQVEYCSRCAPPESVGAIGTAGRATMETSLLMDYRLRQDTRWGEL